MQICDVEFSNTHHQKHQFSNALLILFLSQTLKMSDSWSRSRKAKCFLLWNWFKTTEHKKIKITGQSFYSKITGPKGQYVREVSARRAIKPKIDRPEGPIRSEGPPRGAITFKKDWAGGPYALNFPFSSPVIFVFLVRWFWINYVQQFWFFFLRKKNRLPI
jgi:hypothetical protein